MIHKILTNQRITLNIYNYGFSSFINFFYSDYYSYFNRDRHIDWRICEAYEKNQLRNRDNGRETKKRTRQA